MAAEAGNGEHRVYRVVVDSASGPLIPNEHYLGVDAVAWFINKQSSWFTDRMASGYFAQAELASMAQLMDADMKPEDMSWAGAAGALVSRPEDVNRWARTLFLSDMLNAEQKKELTTVVSTETGETIDTTSAEHPHGFGLGVSGFTAPLGSGWNYEGGTMGYRVVYALLPDKDIVATVALNSAPNDADDQIGKIVLTVLEAVLP